MKNRIFVILLVGVCVFVAYKSNLHELWRSNLPKSEKKPASAQAPTKSENQKQVSKLIAELKKTFKKREFGWDHSMFQDSGWQVGGITVKKRPLLYFTCGKPNSQNSSLILSTVHGDEVTPVYFGFRLVEWLKLHPEVCEKSFIVVAPVVNPDGFLRYSRGTRTNYHKVDLNRNFDTEEWHKSAHYLWKNRYQKKRRYYPGPKPSSEPETKFQEWLISTYKPVKILSIHAPLNILDYDGPKDPTVRGFTKSYIESCEVLKSVVKKSSPIKFFTYGVFPGSLGNYAGKIKGIPTFTMELPTTKASQAPYYFGLLEKSTRIFIEHPIHDSHMRPRNKVVQN
jgi:murein peptide amidase A